MKFTGEQVVLGQTPKRVEAEHLARYAYIRETVKDKVVLDVACGSGYGTASIGEVASEVYGVDISEEAVAHAKKEYESSKTHYILGSAAELTFPDEMFDVVTSFETIEHLTPEDTVKFVKNIFRVLRPGGTLFMSTPNRRVVSPNSKVSLVSAWHTHEYTERELVQLLEKYGLKVVEVRGQRIIPRIFNIGFVRAFIDWIGKVYLKRRVDLYWIPNPPHIVKYDWYHEPRVYFVTAQKPSGHQ